MQDKLRLALFTLVVVAPTSALASPPPARREPPPFAFEACAGKSADDDCSVQFGERAIEGRCVAFHDERLFCMPDDMPPPSDGPPPGERPH